MTYDMNNFMSLTKIEPRHIWGIAGRFIEDRAMGDVHIWMAKGIVLVLQNVLYVPEANIRLISIGKIFNNGYIVNFKSGGFQIQHAGTRATVATGT